MRAARERIISSNSLQDELSLFIIYRRLYFLILIQLSYLNYINTEGVWLGETDSFKKYNHHLQREGIKTRSYKLEKNIQTSNYKKYIR